MKQVMRLESCGRKYTISVEKGVMNPYRVHRFTHGTDRYGYPTWHRKQIARYNDLRSCLILIASDDAFSG